MGEPQYAELEVAKIHPSPFQPRKTFNRLDELAASIVAQGVQTPIKVRKNSEGHEIVFGERRWRASKLAKKTTIPALIVDMTDAEVMEAQLVENAQREDVNALEEGEHFKALTEKHGHTIETLIATTGKSRSHIYGRMKLTQLAPGVKKALLAGELQPAVADLIARIADPKLQEQACKDVLGTGSTGYSVENISYERIYNDDYDAGTNGTKVQPLSYRAAAALIRRKYNLKLALAKFETTHETLIEGVGACTTCEHRSGTQPELPGLPSDKADDLCTKPSCYEAKTKAAYTLAAAAAKDRGLEVLSGADAKEVFTYNDEISRSSKYADPNDALPHEYAKPGSKASWGKLLGKKLAEVPKVLVKDPSGAPRELIDKTAAVKVLRELGKVDKPEPKKATSNSSTSSVDYEKQREREKAKEELAQAAALRVLAGVLANTAKDPGKHEAAWLRWIAHWVIDQVQAVGDADFYLEHKGVKNWDGVSALVEKAKTANDVRALLFEIMMADSSSVMTGGYGTTERKRMFQEGCKLFGADWDKALEQAKEAAKAEAKLEAAKEAKKPAAAKPKKGKGK